MNTSEKHQKIMDILSDRKPVSTDDLAKTLNISLVTMRRDLRELQTSGYIVNGYGFVKLMEPEISDDSHFFRRLSNNRVEKERVARAAIEYVNEGDVLFLDESSTSYVFALELVKNFQRLHIITNAVYALMALSKAENFTVESSGGSLLHGFSSLVGPKAEANLKSVYAGKFFFSCRSFKEKQGTFELSPFSASVKRIMLENSEENFLYFDHTKFGSISPFHLAAVDEIDNIITDTDDPRLPYGKVKNIKIAGD